jgi:hypothetical protein
VSRLLVRLCNPARANAVIVRKAQYQFDENGYTTCGDLEDIAMLVKQQGCEIVEALEGDGGMNNNHQFCVVDFKTLAGQHQDDALLEQLNKLRNEDWKPFLVKHGKALFYK